MLRVESPLDEDVVQEATAHDEPAVLKMDPMEPLRRLVIAILCEPTPSSDFDAVDTQGLHRKVCMDSLLWTRNSVRIWYLEFMCMFSWCLVCLSGVHACIERFLSWYDVVLGKRLC